MFFRITSSLLFLLALHTTALQNSSNTPNNIHIHCICSTTMTTMLWEKVTGLKVKVNWGQILRKGFNKLPSRVNIFGVFCFGVFSGGGGVVVGVFFGGIHWVDRDREGGDARQSWYDLSWSDWCGMKLMWL